MKLNVTVLALAVSFAASADTVAWWHFDECEPGTTAPANTVASDQSPTTYAHVYTVGEFDAVRVSKGVLDPSKFLGRVPKGLVLSVH